MYSSSSPLPLIFLSSEYSVSCLSSFSASTLFSSSTSLALLAAAAASFLTSSFSLCATRTA